MNGKPYNPQAKTAAMLARALELVNSVPYAVSLRWLFYRVLQEGFYSSKDDYNNKFAPAVSAARHAFYNGWRPDTLADETREAIVRGDGYKSVEAWLGAVATGLYCHLDKWNYQDTYVELWYEARAMSQQFEHYTSHMTLRPLGGQPSIPYKWQAAKDIEHAFARYRLPVVILYFGDLDSAGDNIAQVVERDVRGWCSVDFSFVHCGLNAEQVNFYGVPENPEKPGEYQWEALTDDAARAIITNHTERYLRTEGLDAAQQTEWKVTEWLRGELVGLADKWQDAKA